METNITILQSDVTNPWFNLAIEDWIFRKFADTQHVLFLWRNQDSIVIGRNQNPWVECKTDKIEADGVMLARRQSGGGTVYHDLGNTNFTFMSPAQDYDIQKNFRIITNALANLGIHAEISPRNDILVDGAKISGSAFKQTQKRKFHHGTLLIHADLGKLNDYLQPHAKKVTAKGTKSVRSRVANLTEFNPFLSHTVVCDAVMQSFCDYYGEQVTAQILDENSVHEYEDLQKYYQTMTDWQWRYGKTPEFVHTVSAQFVWGEVSMDLTIKHAKISAITLTGSQLDDDCRACIEAKLHNVLYKIHDIQQALRELVAQHPHWHEYIANINMSLKNEIKH